MQLIRTRFPRMKINIFVFTETNVYKEVLMQEIKLKFARNSGTKVVSTFNMLNGP